MSDLLEFLFEMVFDTVILSGQRFFRNGKISKPLRLSLAVLLFLGPVILLMLLTPLLIEINSWWLYLIMFGIELYFGYLAVKYVKGILFGFKE
ncbi:hypothetical protein [Marinilactibacillus piezotolerans]|uniref:hypothetical protein n=1 Tax=Marinilactibacillus piezotolerans TaxID=258723 RepID=UPI0009B04C90|nr:hypothetical protein [Marinilactibacillus piezotolerans]